MYYVSNEWRWKQMSCLASTTKMVYSVCHYCTSIWGHCNKGHWHEWEGDSRIPGSLLNSNHAQTFLQRFRVMDIGGKHQTDGEIARPRSAYRLVLICLRYLKHDVLTSGWWSVCSEYLHPCWSIYLGSKWPNRTSCNITITGTNARPL